MKKSELIELYAEATGLPNSQAAEALEKLGDIMAAELLAGGEVPLPRVGKLLTGNSPARMARNPKTGAAIEVPARRKVQLRVAKELKDSLN